MPENTTDWTLEFARSQMHDEIERVIDSLTPGNIERLAKDPTAFDDILAIHELARTTVEELLLDTVTAARAAGRTWGEIGSALGITRQEAQIRFTGVHDDEPAPLGTQLVTANTEADELAQFGLTERRLIRDTPYRIPVDAFNQAGKFGWRMVGATIKPDWMAINVTMELTDQQWEHAVTSGLRSSNTGTKKLPPGGGWVRLDTPKWWGYSYWVRPLNAPALPGRPDPERFILT